jgi:Flp pilus assembly pilin Flp
MENVRNLYGDTRGVTTLEYVMLAGLVAIFCILAWQTFGTNLSTVINGQAATINTIPTQ